MTRICIQQKCLFCKRKVCLPDVRESAGRCWCILKLSSSLSQELLLLSQAPSPLVKERGSCLLSSVIVRVVSSATFPWLAHTNNITLPPLFLLSTIKFANFPLGAERLWQHWHGLWPLIRPRYRNSFPHKIQLGNWFLAKTKQGKHLFHLHLNIKF